MVMNLMLGMVAGMGLMALAMAGGALVGMLGGRGAARAFTGTFLGMGLTVGGVLMRTTTGEWTTTAHALVVVGGVLLVVEICTIFLTGDGMVGRCLGRARAAR